MSGVRVFWLEPTGERDERENHLYRRGDTGELTTLGAAPAGAMWDAHWMASECRTGPDGITLCVKLPNGSTWSVDQQCSNCTRDQYGPTAEFPEGRCWLGRTHYCWVRHGDPRTGTIHVDKNGETCSAGAGSILSGDYHGFLHDSHLVSC